MDELHGLEEKLLRLRSLSRIAEKKVAEAKVNDANVSSQENFMELQLRALRRRTLLRILLQLQSNLQSQRQKLNTLTHETTDRRR